MSSSDWLKFQSDPSSAGFLPSAYIQQALSNVKHANLEKKLVEGVYQSQRETEQELKSLIRENLGTFIDSRDAMRSILNADRQLFSGEALGAMVSIFENGRDQCEALVAPMMETHQQLYFARELRELLEKFHPITAVPQMLYHACGVRVWSAPLSLPQKKTGERDTNEGTTHFSSSPTKNEVREAGAVRPRGKSVTGAAGGSGVGSGDGGASSGEGSPCSHVRRCSSGGNHPAGGSCGPLNRLSASPFPYNSEEELFFWYGTILARHARRSRKKNVASRYPGEKGGKSTKVLNNSLSQPNVLGEDRRGEKNEGVVEEIQPVPLDIAVVQFRRALLFLEEHYFPQRSEQEESGIGRNPYHTGENNSDGIGRGRRLVDSTDIIGETPAFHSSSPRHPNRYQDKKGFHTTSMHSAGTADALETSSGEQNLTVGSLSFTERSAHPQRLAQQMQRERIHQLFMLTYTTSLLRAALYLLDHLASEHLRYINLVHTVAIEEILRMMMELSVGTVKLHGFAREVRDQLCSNAAVSGTGAHGVLYGSGGAAGDGVVSGNKDASSDGLAWTTKSGRREGPSASESFLSASHTRFMGSSSSSGVFRGAPVEHNDNAPLTIAGMRMKRASKEARSAPRFRLLRRPISSAAGHWHPVQYYMEVLQWQYQELVCRTLIKPLSLRATLALQQPQSVLRHVLSEGSGTSGVNSSNSNLDNWRTSIRNDILNNWSPRNKRREFPAPSSSHGGGSMGSWNKNSSSSCLLRRGPEQEQSAVRKESDGSLHEMTAVTHTSAVLKTDAEADEMEDDHIDTQGEALDKLTDQFFALAEKEIIAEEVQDEDGKLLGGDKEEKERSSFGGSAWESTVKLRGWDGGSAAGIRISSLTSAFASRLYPYPFSGSKEDISFIGSHLFHSNSTTSSLAFENLLSVRVLAPSLHVEVPDDNHSTFFSFPIDLPNLHGNCFQETRKKYAANIQQKKERMYVDATPILLYSCEQLIEHIRHCLESTAEKTVEGLEADSRSIGKGWNWDAKGNGSNMFSRHSAEGILGDDFVVDAYVLLSEIAYLLEDTIAHYWAGVGQSIQARAFDHSLSSETTTMWKWLQDEEKRKRARRRRQRGRRQRRLRQRNGGDGCEVYELDLSDTDSDGELGMQDEDEAMDWKDGENHDDGNGEDEVDEEEEEGVLSLDQIANASTSLFLQESKGRGGTRGLSFGSIGKGGVRMQKDHFPELRFLPVTTEPHVNRRQMYSSKVLLRDKDVLGPNDEAEKGEEEEEEREEEEPEVVHRGDQHTRGSAHRTLRQRLEDQKVVWRSKISLQKYAILRLQELIRSAGLIMRSILTAFINHCMVHVFIPLIQQFSPKDLLFNNRDERVEIMASLVVEALLQQWKQMLMVLCDSFLEIKRAIIESFSAAMMGGFPTSSTASTVGGSSGDHHTSSTSHASYSAAGKKTIVSGTSTPTEIRQSMLNDASTIITEVETLRSACVKDYIRGVGMLMNAYVSLFPFIRHTSEAALERRVRPRLCREHPSSATSNKLLNTLSVLLDHTVPFLHREEEVYDYQAFFAGGGTTSDGAAAGAGGSGSTPGGAPGGSGAGMSHRRHTGAGSSRGRLSIRFPDGIGGAGRSPGAPGEGTAHSMEMERDTFLETSDLIVKLSTFQKFLVLENVQRHGKYIGQLCSDFLLVFVDMIHMKCQLVCAAAEDTKQFSVTARQREIVACMADMLCLTYTLIPLFMEHLLAPSLLAWLVMLDPNIRREDRPDALLDLIRRYQKQHLARVDGHAQLALSAIVQMHLVVPQQQITQAVYQDGFAKPEMDWQRASRLTTAEVRPYLSDVLVIIAEANEALHWIEQPALASAVTQKLLVHLATTMMMGLTVNANYVELLAADCSVDYYAHGALLLEAEFSTVCKLLETVQQATPKAHILPELPSALQLLHHWLKELIHHHQNMLAPPRCQAEGPQQQDEKAMMAGDTNIYDGNTTTSLLEKATRLGVESRKTARAARREDLTQVAMRHLAYMLEVILNSQWQSCGKPDADDAEDDNNDDDEEEEDGEDMDEEDEEGVGGSKVPTWLERLLVEVEEKDGVWKGAPGQSKKRLKKGKKGGGRVAGDGGANVEKKNKKRKKKYNKVGGEESTTTAVEKAGVAPPSLIAESVMKELAKRIEIQYEKDVPAPPRHSVLPSHMAHTRRNDFSYSTSVGQRREGGKVEEELPAGQHQTRTSNTAGKRHHGLFSHLYSSNMALQDAGEKSLREEEDEKEEEEELGEAPEQLYANVWRKAKHHPLNLVIGGSGEKLDVKGRSKGEKDEEANSPLAGKARLSSLGEAGLLPPTKHMERRARLRLGSGDGSGVAAGAPANKVGERMARDNSILSSDRPFESGHTSETNTEKGSPALFAGTDTPGSPFSRDSFLETTAANERPHTQQRRHFKRTTFL